MAENIGNPLAKKLRRAAKLLDEAAEALELMGELMDSYRAELHGAEETTLALVEVLHGEAVQNVRCVHKAREGSCRRHR